MMRTIEIFIVILIITSAFIVSSFFTVLPQPQRVSPINLRRLALTTLQTLDARYDLSEIVFKPPNDPAWEQLRTAISTCLPPNMFFNLSVYEVLTDSGTLYRYIKSISNAENLGLDTDASSYLVASANVTFDVIPEKIGEFGNGGTLYILNCSDANGWWITGYTARSLAEDLYKLLSPYFIKTIMVQTTTDFGKLLNGTALQNETLQNAVVINTFGEAAPIPAGYYTSSGVGYDQSQGSYARFFHTLGQRVRQYNWTWVSIVGYPLYYVSNTGYFTGPSDHNGWGIYGMRQVGAAGFNAFLRGLDAKSYSYNSTWITGSPGVVYLNSTTLYYCNYYGIYPAPYHTATRALPFYITANYHLRVTTYVFDKTGNWMPGAVYRHVAQGATNITGSFFALGLTRTPDIKLTVLGLLSDYKPRLYRSEYTASNTSRLVVLQLGQIGGT